MIAAMPHGSCIQAGERSGETCGYLAPWARGCRMARRSISSSRSPWTSASESTYTVLSSSEEKNSPADSASGRGGSDRGARARQAADVHPFQGCGRPPPVSHPGCWRARAMFLRTSGACILGFAQFGLCLLEQGLVVHFGGRSGLGRCAGSAVWRRCRRESGNQSPPVLVEMIRGRPSQADITGADENRVAADARGGCYIACSAALCWSLPENGNSRVLSAQCGVQRHIGIGAGHTLETAGASAVPSVKQSADGTGLHTHHTGWAGTCRR